MGDLWDARLTPADAEIIRSKAQKINGHYGYRATDIDDLRQELAMHVFPRTHLQRDARGSRAAFVSKVTANKLLSIIEKRTAQRRDARRETQMIAEDSYAASDTDQPAAESRIDVTAAISRLPLELREIACRLKTDSVTEVARATGLTRQQVRGRMAQIARIFQALGIQPDI